MSTEKVFELESKIDTIICDIEGTTTSISFVKVWKISINSDLKSET